MASAAAAYGSLPTFRQPWGCVMWRGKCLLGTWCKQVQRDETAEILAGHHPEAAHSQEWRLLVMQEGKRERGEGEWEIKALVWKFPAAIFSQPVCV